MMRARLSGIILAGGRSTRMGCDKAFLPWAETTLIEHLVKTLRPVTQELLVVVKDRRRFAYLPARIVEDLIPETCALAGLYTGLRAAAHERCFVCTCDMPFLNARLVRFLAGQVDDGFDMVIPRTSGGLEPLHAIYTRRMLETIRHQLRSEERDLRSLATKVRAKIVAFETSWHLDATGRSFFNVNTPEDYAAACRMRIAPGIRHGTVWDSNH